MGLRFKGFIPVSLICMVAAIIEVCQSKPDCGGKPADIVFVLDASRSIWNPHFKKQLTFVKNVAKQFDISPNTTRVAVITYSNAVRVEFDLDSFSQRKNVLNAIEAIHQTNGETRTDLALDQARLMMAKKGRPSAPKLIIIMTDGRSNDPKMTEEKAKAIHENNIYCIAVGIGHRISLEELEILATTKEDVFTVDTYDALEGIRSVLAATACEVQESKVVTASEEWDEFYLPTLSPDGRPPPKGCGGRPADVVLMLDGSSSIWPPDFRKQLIFVQNLVSIFEISPEATRFGLLTFGDHTEGAFGLRRYTEELPLLKAITKVQQNFGGTNTAAAIHTMARRYFAPQHTRKDVVKIGIIVTDGRSDNPRQTAEEAAAAKGKGIHLFAIGVGDQVDRQELMNIASTPLDNYFFQVNTYDALYSLKDLLAFKACQVTNDPEPYQHTTPAWKTTTKTQQADQGCGASVPADIVFSFPTASGGSNTKHILKFLKRSIEESLDISKNQVRVGFVPQNCHREGGFHLSETTNKWDTLKKFKSFNNKNSSTEENAANIKHMRSETFVNVKNSRDGVKKIGVVMMDQHSRDVKSTAWEAWNAKNMDNIELFMVAISKDVNQVEKQAIASEPQSQHIIAVGDYENLEYYSEQFVQQLNTYCRGLE